MIDDITKTEAMKRCGECDELKILTDFYIDARTRDGKSRQCIVCDRKRHERWFVDLASKDNSFCGTEMGYLIHRSKGEDYCNQCRLAHSQRGTAEAPPPNMTNKTPARHGTVGAHMLHIKAKESSCSLCLEMNRLYERARDHGISIEAVILLTLQFNGMCWACGILPAEHIDHNHEHRCQSTKQSCGECVRGVLCQPCNLGEGSLRHWDEGRFAVFGGYYDLTSIAKKIIAEFPRVRRPRNQTISDILGNLFGSYG